MSITAAARGLTARTDVICIHRGAFEAKIKELKRRLKEGQRVLNRVKNKWYHSAAEQDAENRHLEEMIEVLEGLRKIPLPGNTA